MHAPWGSNGFSPTAFHVWSDFVKAYYVFSNSITDAPAIWESFLAVSCCPSSFLADSSFAPPPCPMTPCDPPRTNPLSEVKPLRCLPGPQNSFHGNAREAPKNHSRPNRIARFDAAQLLWISSTTLFACQSAAGVLHHTALQSKGAILLTPPPPQILALQLPAGCGIPITPTPRQLPPPACASPDAACAAQLIPVMKIPP